MAQTNSSVNLDAVGIFYVVFCSLWTLLLAVGVSFLWRRRNLPLVKVRGIHLTFTAIAFLHTYWMAVQLAYIANPFPAQAQFWIMGLYLPIGIALFHASNSRFLYVAKQQRRFAQEGTANSVNYYKKLGRWRLGGHTGKMMPFIGVGITIQVLLTIAMYLLSRKFHPSFGLSGTEVQGNPWEVNTRQTTGWEWWPSLVWQFFWSWIVAPVVLWRARRIHDTLGWRTQTMLCCLASLPATPMWVIALYVPAMTKVNKYWMPPQWIAVSIMGIEVLSVFLPCWQAMRHQALQQETLDIIAAWESRNNTRETNSIGATTLRKKVQHESFFLEKASKGSASTSSTAWSDSSLLNMSALERTLEENPGPLREFSALNDFSGENIAFLAAVAEWKSTYSTENIRNQFIRALGIYHEFVSPQYAEFQINISFQEMAQLEATFEQAARIIYGDSKKVNSSVIPFKSGSDWPMEVITPRRSKGSEVHDSPDASTRELRSSLKHVSYWGEIPMGFNAEIFDQSERSIKYLVLTNTWPKFLSWKSSEMSRSDFNLTNYDSSIMSRISRLLSCDA
ncbi:hypothetical protein N0V93_000239 [Gnomoniopsis smithogilvyi]|uniref:RGS domain-containing protein n=1 Tax=Gnomoniopsis smithogilvyi TaxID=1191159 RepID=A0A9W8Z1J2_9PEZI|nr:hypothetical protein N0V93_000239 [Gnomoniopsis smithogilvyi]